MKPGTRIELEHVYPPLPIRSFDWRATFDGYEPGDPMGYGPTKEAAIGDLLDQVYDDTWTPADSQAASDAWAAEQERRLEADDGVAP